MLHTIQGKNLVESSPRTIYIFKARVKILQDDIDRSNRRYYSKKDAFVNNLSRYENPFVQGPRVVIYSKQNDRVVGVLYVKGLPSATVVEQECVLYRRRVGRSLGRHVARSSILGADLPY